MKGLVTSETNENHMIRHVFKMAYKMADKMAIFGEIFMKITNVFVYDFNVCTKVSRNTKPNGVAYLIITLENYTVFIC